MRQLCDNNNNNNNITTKESHPSPSFVFYLSFLVFNLYVLDWGDMGPSKRTGLRCTACTVSFAYCISLPFLLYVLSAVERDIPSRCGLLSSEILEDFQVFGRHWRGCIPIVVRVRLEVGGIALPGYFGYDGGLRNWPRRKGTVRKTSGPPCGLCISLRTGALGARPHWWSGLSQASAISSSPVASQIPSGEHCL